MEALGEKIRRSREDKGYSLDQVARDTHITKRFLEALEAEDFSTMPGESYTLGFLRSYTEFLGLNPDEMVALYKNIKLQEQPAPMQELLVKSGMGLVSKVLLGAAGLVVLIVLGVLIYLTGRTDDSKIGQTKTAPSDEKLVVFDTATLERDFKDGDIIRLPLDGKNIDMALGHKGDRTTLNLNGNIIELATGKEWPIDVNQDGITDLRMTTPNLDTRARPTKISIKLERVLAPGTTLPPTGTGLPGTSDAGNFPPVGVPKYPSRVRSAVTLAESAAASPLSFQLVFKQPVFFRYVSDQGKTEERFSQPDEMISITGNSLVRVWIADGSQALFRVNGKDTAAGADGEISAWQVAWAPEASGQQALQLQPLY